MRVSSIGQSTFSFKEPVGLAQKFSPPFLPNSKHFYIRLHLHSIFANKSLLHGDFSNFRAYSNYK